MNSNIVNKRQTPEECQGNHTKISRMEGVNDIVEARQILSAQVETAMKVIKVIHKATGREFMLTHTRNFSGDQRPTLPNPPAKTRTTSEDPEPLFIGELSVQKYFDSRQFYHLWSSSTLEKSNPDFLWSYKVIKKIGEGGYGQVFHARRHSDNKLVAVKFFNESSLNERAHPSLKLANPHLKKVPTELNAMIELEQVPGVVQLYEVYYSNKMDYLLVMETSDNVTSLKKHLKERGRLSEEEACHYFKQIVESLDLMYQKKRHHFDLKCSNILLDRYSGKTMLIDFGGAQRVLKKNFENWVGTTQNFPPEYFSDKKFYGIPVESWCLGLLLLQMTTGHLPVSSDLKENFKRSYNIPTILSQDLRVLITQCLSRNPRSRPNFKKILDSSWIQKKGNLPFQFASEHLTPVAVDHRHEFR